MLQLRWPPSAEAEVPLGEGVEVSVGPVEVRAAAETTVRNPWERNIQIYLQGSGMGALCTENGGGGLISVPNPPPAHGRTFSLPNHLKNETGTSPETQWTSV